MSRKHERQKKPSVNRPTFVMCGDDNGPHFDPMRCWRHNHIPYVGLLERRYGTMVAVWRVIMRRYLRLKMIAWPDEARAFGDLYLAKHTEISYGRVLREEVDRFGIFGGYFDRRNGQFGDLFGSLGVLPWPPVSPKPRNRNKELARLVMMTAKDCSRKVRYG